MATAVLMDSLKVVEARLAQVPVVGYTVYWRLSGVRIGHADYANRLRAAGFAGADPGKPSAQVALRRALDLWKGKYGRALAKGSGGSDDTASRIRIVDISSKGNETVFGIVRERRNHDKKSVRHTTEARVFVEHDTRAISVTLKDEGDYDSQFNEDVLEDQIRPFWRYAQDVLDSGDVSASVLRIVGRLDSVRLRPEGGVYFVPATRQDDLRVLKTLVEGINGACFLATLGIPNLDEYKSEAVRSVHEGLISDLDEAARELDLLLSESKPLESTVAARLREYRRLKGKVEIYAEALGMQTDKAMARLDGLTAKVKELL